MIIEKGKMDITKVDPLCPATTKAHEDIQACLGLPTCIATLFRFPKIATPLNNLMCKNWMEVGGNPPKAFDEF